MADDPDAFQNAIIADMRAHDGVVTQGPLAGHPLLIVTMTGATSGQPRRALLTLSRDGDDYIVAATAGGAPTDPVWLRNLDVHPEVTVERENRTFAARATVIREDPEHDRLWDAHVAALPWFADYPAKSGRVIPVVRLSPLDSTSAGGMF